jgi:hypothetical protein
LLPTWRVLQHLKLSSEVMLEVSIPGWDTGAGSV